MLGALRAVARKEALLVTRAKKAAKGKGGKGGKKKKPFVPTWNKGEMPKNKLRKLIFLWERCIEPGKVYQKTMPWKEGEEPEWVNNILRQNHAKTPTAELDPTVVGRKYIRKRENREAIQLKNFYLKEGMYSRALGKSGKRRTTSP